MNKILYAILMFAAILLISCNTKKSTPQIEASGETMLDSLPGSCPYLTKDHKNNIIVSWIRKTATGYVFCYAISTDQGKSFTKPVPVPGSENIHPHGENLPKIIFKTSGEIITAWGASNPNPANPYAGLVYYSQSRDNGISWSKPVTVTTDSSSYDQRYFDLALLPNGEAGIVWLDNRKTKAAEGSGLFYAETKGDKGFSNEKLISEPCCQCCRTDLFVDSKKNRHVVYRGIINDSIRDMVHIFSEDGGNTFSTPQRISPDNWVINGCPHTGPAMTENKEGLFFTWFTGGNDAGIYTNNSNDNGRSFASRSKVAGKDAKHCQLTTLDPGRVLIVWNENVPGEKGSVNRIGVAPVNKTGKTPAASYITSPVNNATFPVLQVIDGSKILLAYTVEKNKTEQIFYQQLVWQ
ncbi:MAG: sialidase family protein [Bacteroidota bacterium]